MSTCEAPVQRTAGVFAEYQPLYARHGIATFPVRNKRPVVTNYLKMGLPASRQLADRFGDADGLGFVCGKRSGVTVLDVDSSDESELADALALFGPSPLIVRSGSGNFQAWYRHSGEARQIRPFAHRPWDMLGGGYVVAPPSRAARGSYTIIEGSLDCLRELPAMRVHETPEVVNDASHRERAPVGKRNEALWRECMKAARHCLNASELLVTAAKANEERLCSPLPDDEVLRIVASAWATTERGDNLFGAMAGSVVASGDQIRGLLPSCPDAFILLMILRHHHGGREFVCANAMAATMPGGGWPRQRLATARRKLEEIGEIVMVRPASKQHGPATYRFKGVRI